MFSFKHQKTRRSIGSYASALFALAATLILTSDAKAQICQGSIASGATITPPLNVPVHIGDTLTINLVDVANQAASVRTTNTDLYIILPDGSTNHVATDVNLSASSTCGDADGPGFFGCPGNVTIGAFSSGTCIPYPGTYVVRFADIHRPLNFAITKGGITATFGNNGGTAKQIQFLVAAAGQSVNGDTPSAGPVIPRVVIFPCISITKTCDNACTPYGQPILFHGTVSNTGDSALSGITVTDTPPAGSTSSTITFDNVQPSNRPWDGTLAAGESAVYHGSYTPPNNGGTSLCGPFTDTISATAVDASGTAISNTDACIDSTTGVSTGPRSPVTATCNVCNIPCVQVTKICPSITTVNLSAPSYTVSGSVTNCGDVPLVNVVVTDNITNADGTFSTVTVTNIASLGIGESVQLPPQTITPTICGPSADQFTVTAQDLCPGQTVAPASSQICTVTVVSTPCLAVTKVCPSSGTVNLSSPAYTVSGFVTNCGTATMTNIVVTDTITNADGTHSTITVTNISSLAAGASVALPPQTITPTLCGPSTDIFNVSGTDVCGNRATANSAICTVTVVSTPCMAVTKICPADTTVNLSSPSYTVSGFVTNCGTATMTNIVVTDTITNANGTHTTITVTNISSLAAGASVALPPQTITPTLCGASTDIFNVSGTDVCGNNATANSAICTVTVVSTPCLAVTKICPTVTTINFNDSYTVSGFVTNCGTATMTNVVVTDIVTDANGNKVTNVVTTITSLATGAFQALPDQTITPTLCGPSTDLFSVSGTDVCGNAATANSQTCTVTVLCRPCIGVTKLIACGPCGANPAGLSYGPIATGVAGTNNPAFCYQIVVTNCGLVTLTNVQISDPTLGLTFTLPTNLPPGTATAPIFTGASFGVGNVTNTVAATGQSEATGETVTTNASAVAIVVPASVTCKVDLSSSVNQNTNNSPPCEVTLPPNSVNSPVTVTLTINNTGQADLDVSIIGGNILTSGLVNCTGGGAVTFGTVFVPAGATTNFVVGCVAVRCPGTNITAVVQGTAVASKSIPCVLDISGNAITTAPSQCSECVNCLVAPPCIQVSKLIACGPCGSNPASLSYGPTATGVAGTNNPAFCYQIVVTNCGGITLTNVQVSDPTLGLTFTLPTNLPPGTATAPIFTGTSFGVGTVTNTVTATGQSQATGQTTTAHASAVAIVVPASVTCKVDLSSSLNVNTNGSGACPVTLPTGTTNAPVTVTLTINNTGQADLNVNIVGGDILTSALFDCDALTNITFGTVFVPAGTSTNFVVGCVAVSCPGTNITAVVQGTAVASTSIPCVFDVLGNAITTAPSQCSQCVNCAVAVSCRVTGGGTLQPGATDSNCVTLTTILSDDEQCAGSVLDHISHGGQLGAPFDQQDCGQILGNPCIRGQWQHNRHYQGTGNPQDTINVDFHSFNANTGPLKGVFDTLQCACLGCCNNGTFIGSAIGNALCNPDDHKICGPEPRPAPANAIIFTGLGVFSPANCGASGKNQPDRWFVFRVYIEDRSEPGGLHPGGSVEPADVYCFQAWDTGITVVKHSNASNVATSFRACLAADSCAFIKSISTSTPTGVPPGTLPSSTVCGMPADINDCGPLYSGNHQIHPSTGADCTTTTPLQIIP